MNIAQSPDSAPFKPEWMKTHTYDFERIDGQACLTQQAGEDKLIKPVEVYCGVDPASSLSARADYFCIAVIGIDFNGNKYAIDFVREQRHGSIQSYSQEEIIFRFEKSLNR